MEPSVVSEWVTDNNIDFSVDVSARTGAHVEESIVNLVAHIVSSIS